MCYRSSKAGRIGHHIPSLQVTAGFYKGWTENERAQRILVHPSQKQFANSYRCKQTDNASENTYSLAFNSLFLADKKIAWCISSIFSFQPANTLLKSFNHSPKSHQWRQKSPQIKQRSIQQHGQMEKRQTLSFTTEALGFSLFFWGAPGTLENLKLTGEPVLAYTSCI